MKKNKTAVLIAALALAAGTQIASATPISGVISFGIGMGENVVITGGTGNRFQNGTGLDFANTNPNALITATTGSFVGETGGATFADFQFAPLSPVGIQVWTTDNYHFNLGSITSVVRTDTSLAITGTGLVSSDFATDTATDGVFHFSTQGNGADANFSWSADTDSRATVPDGGATAILLGASMLGLGFLSRRTSVA